MEKAFEFGVSVQDKITGLSGRVTGYTSYITGCDRALVAPPVDKEGKHVDGRWFDVNRLVVVDPTPISIDTEDDKGACESAPVK